MRHLIASLAVAVSSLGAQAAPRPPLSAAVRAFVAADTAVLALTHVRVIDGTGAPPRDDQTIVIRDGRIAAVGDAAGVQVPANAQVMDLTGKSVIQIGRAHV